MSSFNASSSTQPSSDLLTTLILPAALLLIAICCFTFTPLIQPNRIIRWLQLKRYQYEVTWGLNMMTPTEKFVVNSILFLLLSWLVIATSLYLPEHINTISKRVWYYYSGSGAPVSMG